MKGKFHEIRMTTYPYERWHPQKWHFAQVLAYLKAFIPGPSKSRLWEHRLSSSEGRVYFDPRLSRQKAIASSCRVKGKTAAEEPTRASTRFLSRDGSLLYCRLNLVSVYRSSPCRSEMFTMNKTSNTTTSFPCWHAVPSGYI